MGKGTNWLAAGARDAGDSPTEWMTRGNDEEFELDRRSGGGGCLEKLENTSKYSGWVGRLELGSTIMCRPHAMGLFVVC